MKCVLFTTVVCFMVASASALKCHQCGQYNDGVGSITPCLNYSDTTAKNFVKDCPRNNNNFCIVSEAQ